MRLSIAQLKAAGLTDKQIVKIVDEWRAEQREKNRVRQRKWQQNQRSYNANNAEKRYAAKKRKKINGHITPKSVNDHHESSSRLLSFSNNSLFPETRSVDGVVARARGSRLAPDWKLNEADCAFASNAGLSNAEIKDALAEFKDYWASVPGQRGVKLDWSATWRNSIRRFHQHKHRRNGNGGGRRSGSLLDAIDRFIGDKPIIPPTDEEREQERKAHNERIARDLRRTEEIRNARLDRVPRKTDLRLIPKR